MSSPPDNFSEAFDAIDPQGADGAAITRATTEVSQEPGFYLLDDADGRFTVDAALGFINLRDEAVLKAERGAIHAVRLLVIERSGARYEMPMKLRLTGMIPQMVGAEDFSFAAEAAPISAPAPARQAPPMAWSAYAAASAHGAPQQINDEARFGAAFPRPLPPQAPGPYRLHLFTPLPAPASKSAIWPF